MSLSCRFGDEDVSSETVSCRLDSATNTAYCRQAVGSRRLPLRDFKMEVTLVNEDEEGDETSSLITRQEQGIERERTVAKQPKCINPRHKILRTMIAAIAGEFIGTCLLTLVICTSVAVSVVAGQSLVQCCVILLSHCCRCSCRIMASSCGDWSRCCY